MKPRNSVSEIRVWRPGMVERAVGGTLALSFSVIDIMTIKKGLVFHPPENAILFGFFAVAAVVFFLYTCFTSLTLTPQVAIIRNFGHRRIIPLGEITSLRPGYYGTEFLCKRGKWWISLAVQKPKWAQWLGKNTRADMIVEIIMGNVEDAAKG